MQAAAVYATLAVVEFALSGGMRASWIPEVARAAGELARAQATPSPIPLDDVRIWWWFERARFGLLDLATMGAAILALRASRTKAYFAAMAVDAATKRRDDDGEP
jgi:hypothetical protein